MKKKSNEEELNPNDGGQGQLFQCVIDLATRAAELGHHELSIILFTAAGAQSEGSQSELALLCGEFAKIRLAIEFAKIRLAIQKGLDPDEIKKLLQKDLDFEEDL
jgi:hypothetical protein